MKSHLIANAYNLEYPKIEPEAINSNCVITGEKLETGYLVQSIISKTTNDFWVFGGLENGYMSIDAARCFGASNPRKSMICSKSIAVFGDDGYEPLIDHKAAIKQDRPWWGQLVRDVWELHRDKKCVVILSTDTKTRIWHQPHVRDGYLGEQTPVTVYDPSIPINSTILVNWPEMLKDLDFVEVILGAGFWMRSIQNCLLNQKKNININYQTIFEWERKLIQIRRKPHFVMIKLIARPKESEWAQSQLNQKQKQLAFF